jgi:hypothetical protein
MDHLFVVSDTTASLASATTLRDAGFLERKHLQEWVIANPQILGGDVLVISAEYDKWSADADGTPARDRLDVLGLDATGRLVVVELKRDVADRDVHLQAITYAALVSRFTLETLAPVYRGFLARRGEDTDLDQCRERLRAHIGGEPDPALLRRPRQVLIAASFPKQVTNTVVWLSEMNLDIDLVQISVWRVGDQPVVAFSKIYPTPEAEEFTLAPARGEVGTVAQRVERTRARKAVHILVDAGLLPDGIRLRMVPNQPATGTIRESITNWVKDDPRRGLATWRNNPAKPLRWDADGQDYSPTGLANHVFTIVTGTEAPIQGTTWWVVEESQSPPEGNAAKLEAWPGVPVHCSTTP